mmetsp:Transcript_17299/g.32812  ORF Transcript_17299/g.32812 Transcript_17299/m.32812 type:complete len:91 (-) Transcript_17299:109-381(-)
MLNTAGPITSGHLTNLSKKSQTSVIVLPSPPGNPLNGSSRIQNGDIIQEMGQAIKMRSNTQTMAKMRPSILNPAMVESENEETKKMQKKR